MRELKTYYQAELSTNGNYKIVERKAMGRNRNYFLTKESAKADFLEARKIALEQYEKVLNELNRVRETTSINFRFDYNIEGDTYGIYEESLYIEIVVNGYYFRFEQHD